jgi:hypothetical protein
MLCCNLVVQFIVTPPRIYIPAESITTLLYQNWKPGYIPEAIMIRLQLSMACIIPGPG